MVKYVVMVMEIQCSNLKLSSSFSETMKLRSAAALSFVCLRLRLWVKKGCCGECVAEAIVAHSEGDDGDGERDGRGERAMANETDPG